MRLKEKVAQSSLDFRRSHWHVAVDRDVEQTIFVDTPAGRTAMGWLHGAMLTPPALHAELLETLGVAIEAVLARADLAASSRRSYAQTLVSRGAQLSFVSRPASAETEADGR